MTTDMQTGELAVLRSEAAVRQVVEGYADAVTRNDFATYSSMFAPGAVWKIGPPANRQIEGRDAIVAELTRLIGRLEFFVFTASNFVISVQGDTARCRTTVHEFGRAADGAEPGHPALNMHALYDDELRREGGRWLFTTRNYTMLYLDTAVPTGQSFPAV